MKYERGCGENGGLVVNPSAVFAGDANMLKPFEN
jgi:hypothetical protein